MTERDNTKNEVLVHEVTTDHLNVRYPDLLQVEDAGDLEGVDLALVVKGADLVFRPNLVFTSVPSTAALVDASMTAIMAAGTQHPGAMVVSVDAFFGVSDFIEGPPIGRVLTFTYPATEHRDLMVKKWIIATGEHHLHVSASFLPSQALVVEETFDWIAANLRFAAGLEMIQGAAVRDSDTGVRLDAAGTERAGFPLEDLTMLPVPLPQRARVVPVAAIEVLTSAWGVRLADVKVLHVVVTCGQEVGFYIAYPGKDGMLVVRSSGTSAHAMDTGNVEAYGLSPERLPADAAAWLAIVPAFRFGETWSVSAEEYAAGIAGKAEEEPWTEFLIGYIGRWLRAVFIPDQGFFEAISPQEGVIELQVLPAGRFFDLILRSVDSVLGGAAK